MNENHDPKTGEFSSGGGGGSSHLPPHMQALMQKAREYDANKAKFGIIDRTPAGFGPGPSEAHATMDKNTAAADAHTATPTKADFSPVSEAHRKWQGAEFKHAKLNTALTRTRVEAARKELALARKKAGQ